jgi:hypothetical protein
MVNFIGIVASRRVRGLSNAKITLLKYVIHLLLQKETHTQKKQTIEQVLYLLPNYHFRTIKPIKTKILALLKRPPTQLV